MADQEVGAPDPGIDSQERASGRVDGVLARAKVREDRRVSGTQEEQFRGWQSSARVWETGAMSRDQSKPEQYDPPQVEQIPTEDGPAVTAAGKSNNPGVEWQPKEAS